MKSKCRLLRLSSNPTVFLFAIAALFASVGNADANEDAKPKIQSYPDTPVWSDAQTAKTEFPDYALIGEYVKGDQALPVTPAEGKFYLSLYQGGLPGSGWDRGDITHQWLDGAVPRQARVQFPGAIYHNVT